MIVLDMIPPNIKNLSSAPEKKKKKIDIVVTSRIAMESP